MENNMSKFKVGDKVVKIEYRPGVTLEVYTVRYQCSDGSVFFVDGRTASLLASDYRLAISNTDPVNHPSHYKSHPSGVECIDITEHMGFNLGNALKYIWRSDLKDNAVQDLEKAAWYINREIAKRTK